MVAERRHVLLPPGTTSSDRPAERETPAASSGAAERTETVHAPPPSGRAVPVAGSATRPTAPSSSGGSRMLLGLTLIPKPVVAVLGVIALAIVVLVGSAVLGGGDSSEKPAAKKPAAVATTTTVAKATTTTTTQPAEAALITGERAVLNGPPRGGIKFGTSQIAKPGTKLVAPSVSTGSVKASSWQWVLCGHGTKDCEPVDGATKARWTVTKLAAGNDVRVRVGLGDLDVDALSPPVFVQVG